MPWCLVVLCVLLVAGCASSERESTAGRVAERFIAAVESGDLTAACAQLAPKTRDDLLAEAPDCAEALGSQSLPTSPVGEVSVWGERAQVRTDGGALFLAEFADGWKVVAAGCDAPTYSPPRRRTDEVRDELPYRCVVGG